MAAVRSTLAMMSTLEHAGNDKHAVSEEPGRSQDQSIVGKRLQIEGHAI
ncbi:hypothetical protein [Paenibacillus cellulositrophicus]|nr:hypothetical protein [Paenibacillus cellulositrophicus]